MLNLSLRLRVFLFFLLLACGSVALIAGGLYFGWSRAEPRPDPGALILGGIAASFGILALVAAIWRLFDENVAHPLQAMAAQMRVFATGKAGAPLPAEEARYLGDLAPAAQAISDRLNETQSDLTLAIRRETQTLASEKERLETLLADVSVGIVHCTADHNVVFYNGPARGLLAPCAPPRLDQTIFHCLSAAALTQAHTQLTMPGAERDDVAFLCATSDGARMFAATMRLVPQGNDRAGSYVLSLRDVTAQSGAALMRDALLSDMVDDMRRRAAGLETLVSLQEAPEDDPITTAISDETRAFAASVSDFAGRYENSQAEALAGQQVSARDLSDGAAARLRGLGLSCTTAHDDIMLAADGFMLVTLLGHIGACLQEAGWADTLSLIIEQEGPGALLRLGWTGAAPEIGAAPEMGTLDRWLARMVDMGEGTFPARHILHRHGTEIWPQIDGETVHLCLPLRCRDVPFDLLERGAVYDFSLFEKSRMASLADTPLDDLTYVVFDTETTGLLPNQGDEIVQIAALRLLGNRIVEGEEMDVLVDPGRPIPSASTHIHGITDAMVAGAPDIGAAGAEMHRFATDAVLVAHNAPFDMAFFHKHADAIGQEFDNPVMDTVLLSAVLFGITEHHTLDALCDRLGITIPEHLRHTAMGDTRATAEAFARMLHMLKARGFSTFGEVHAEMQKQKRLYARN